MAEHNLVSCVVEDVLPPPAPASATSVANIPESNSTAVPVFQPPEADPIHVEIQALYEEARDIRDQINALVERLAILMQRTRSDR
jgi:hypothetical protein